MAKQKSTQRRRDAEENPWACTDGMLKAHGCVTRSADDRIHQIKQSEDLNWLRSVLAWKDNQLTVRQAAERRIRQVQKLRASAPLR